MWCVRNDVCRELRIVCSLDDVDTLYLCVRGIYFASFYDFSNVYCNCSDNVVLVASILFDTLYAYNTFVKCIHKQYDVIHIYVANDSHKNISFWHENYDITLSTFIIVFRKDLMLSYIIFICIFNFIFCIVHIVPLRQS